jgi:hypothetical protein
LGTGYETNKEFLPFNKAKISVVKLKLKGQREWQNLKNKRPYNIPSNPYEIYKKDWRGWGDWLGSGVISTNKIYENLKYEKAKKIISKFKFKNQYDHRKKWKTLLKPLVLPANPESVFKNKGWINWRDYLGNQSTILNVKWKSYSDAKKIVRAKNFKSRVEYKNYIKRNFKKKLHIKLPIHPERVYGKSFEGWKIFIGDTYDPHYLSRFNNSRHLLKFKNFSEVKKIVNKFKFESRNDFRRGWRKYNLSKKGIPKNVDRFFKRTKEWKGWADFLGKKK